VLLAGVRILDLTVWRPGPYATQLLADLGADVVKLEPPGGDPMRTYPALFESLNGNKRSIVVDLKSEAGRERVLELAAQADVVIEGFRPGVAARLGVGEEQVRAVNAAVVYCSLSGLGQDGPLALAPGHDLNYMAWSGVLAPDGGTPAVPAIPVADLAGGMAAAFAITAALVGRARSGEGEHIDVAMTDVLATWTGSARPEALASDSSVRGVAGYGTFETADGAHVTLGVLTEDHFWRALCGVLGLEDRGDLGFAQRSARLIELQQLITDAVRRRSRDELVDALLAVDVPAAPVLDRAEMLGLAHLRARGVVTTEDGQPRTGYPVRFDRRPAARITRAPALGEHSEEGFR
jgi:crotonobetainyl-CoA:carnitine CoA-transferase CaiB-like acyl-CoA transferase